ncbi:MAG: topoisomerase C-terminal repeat-containing protein [Prevotellaceae bacterium]|jgi:DNA topoisomerase-3|nr:topoisomerase C-terminal repeat-containing protein [Prevotellaceae bacterium]
MKVVIAEKPSMGKDIARVIGATSGHDGYMEGNSYKVTWAYGHLVELAHKTATNKWANDPLPLSGDFILRPKPDVAKQINVIKTLFSEADEIIVATDAGREGELIFRYLYYYLECKKPFRRLWISSLTNEAIKKGFDELKSGREFDNLYFAAKARSESDWLVGVNATRALTLTVNNGEVFSLGRVQTPTLAVICKRYLDNKNFISEPFWSVFLETEKNGIAFKARYGANFKAKSEAEAIRDSITNLPEVLVKTVETKEKKEAPPLLYDLTGLQKAASKKYGITPDVTLKICQSLYENKYLSYPRTGSCYIPDDVFATVPNLIKQCKMLNITNTNTSFYDTNPTFSKNCVNASKVADHHGLLPTDNIPDLEKLAKAECSIYKMVVCRLFEAFHERCIKDVTNVVITAGGYDFNAKGIVIKQAGWREVVKLSSKEREEENEENAASETEEEGVNLPVLLAGENLPNKGIEMKEGKTKPSPLFTDATLLGYMETAGKECVDEHEREAMKDCGIGTPATRDAIISNLLDKLYIIREKKKLIPTEKALEVYNIIKEKAIGSAAMTGNWEKQLLDIQKGSLSYDKFMYDIEEFAKQLTSELSTVQVNIKSQKQAMRELMPLCPKCKKQHLRLFEKGIGCNKECGFVAWRSVAQKKLTDAQLIALIEKEKTPVIKGFTSKTGKQFDARVVLKPDLTTGFEFDNKK